MGDVSVHPAPLWSVPSAWGGKTFAVDLYKKVQALSRLQVQLLAHQDTHGFPCRNLIQFLWPQGSLESWCGWPGLWGQLEDVPTGIQASGGSWPGASGCSQLLTGSSSACPALDWALGVARGCSADHPWHLALGDVWRSA